MHLHKSNIIAVTIIFAILLALSFYPFTKNPEKNEKIKEIGKLKIETSIIPLASISNYIGGDFVETYSIIPAGISPHGFDLTPQNVINIKNADLIIYLGLEHIDGFLNKVLENKNILNVSDGIELIYGVEEEEEGYEGEVFEADPHIWGSPTNAKIIAEKITTKLSKILPEQKEYFQNNLKKFENEIEETLNTFKIEMEGKNPNSFIVFHDAYNYLLKDLNIDTDKKLIFQTRLFSESNLNEMQTLIDEIQEKSVKIVFKEPQFSNGNLEKFANEWNLTISNLDPIGTQEQSYGYIKNLKNNLENLKLIYE